jgi:hypothetical protein
MKNVIGNQRGMSLIGVVVAMGIMGILMMVLADMTVMMTKNNTTALANSDILAYVNQIRSNIQDPMRATTMLAGNQTTGAVVVNDPLVSGTILAQAGMKPNNAVAWSIKRVGFENVLPAGATGLYRLTLVLITEKTQGMVIGPTIARRVVGDVYCFVASNVITTCTGGTDPVAQAKVQCQALGGTWVDAAAFGSQCTLRLPASTGGGDDDKDKGDHNHDGHEDNGHGSYGNSNGHPCNH